MSTFVGTSALMAVMDADDQNHEPAGATWKDLVAGETVLVCSNYILVEA